MLSRHATAAALAAIFVLHGICPAQTQPAPATQPSASDLKDKPDEWFASDEGRRAVAFIISKQLPVGGWEKEYHKTPQPDWEGIGTIDNGYTYTELRVLAATTAWDAAAIARHLQGSGIEAQVRRGEPNLEDVFVAATRKPARNVTGAAA